MTRLMTTAAALCLAALPAAAQVEDQSGPVDSRDATFMQSAEGVDVVNGDGDVIGEVEEILIDTDGAPAGFHLELGGFLDIGERDVRVPLDALSWSGTNYVSTMTEDQLNNLSEFDE